MARRNDDNDPVSVFERLLVVLLAVFAVEMLRPILGRTLFEREVIYWAGGLNFFYHWWNLPATKIKTVASAAFTQASLPPVGAWCIKALAAFTSGLISAIIDFAKAWYP